MESAYKIKMYDLSGNCRIEEVCFYFRYIKEIYTPYVYFEGRFLSSFTEIGEIKRVEFLYDNRTLHVGLVDSVEISQNNNRSVVYVKSKGFTSLLCQNQPEPGMMKDANLQKIISSYSDIPYISCEATGSENYIYIKDGSTIWDAICNLCFRKNGIYPYIERTNTVRISRREAFYHYRLKPENIISSGVKHDFTRVISHVHMQDINGSYNVYSKKNQAALDRNIIRHKQIPLDRQFLYNPGSAPDYKLYFSMRGMIYRYIRRVGFSFEELLDQMTYGDFLKEKNIHRIEVVFDGGRVVTELGTYDDGFFS